MDINHYFRIKIFEKLKMSHDPTLAVTSNSIKHEVVVDEKIEVENESPNCLAPFRTERK